MTRSGPLGIVTMTLSSFAGVGVLASLDELELESQQVRVVATFEDGEALFAAVCRRGHEGLVAKRLRDPYRSGERGWVKTKNRATARWRKIAAPTHTMVSTIRQAALTAMG